MKNKERIAELERRVAELEAQPAYQPWWGITTPPWATWGRCLGCGGSLTNGHQCPSFTITTASTERYIYEGALS